MNGRISWFGVLARLAAALAVVLLTYNPTGHSFYDWAIRDFSNLTAVKAFSGALLLVGWVICIRAALTSMHGSMFFTVIANGIGTRPMEDSEWTCGSFPDAESGMLL